MLKNLKQISQQRRTQLFRLYRPNYKPFIAFPALENLTSLDSLHQLHHFICIASLLSCVNSLLCSKKQEESIPKQKNQFRLAKKNKNKPKTNKRWDLEYINRIEELTHQDQCRIDTSAGDQSPQKCTNRKKKKERKKKTIWTFQYVIMVSMLSTRSTHDRLASFILQLNIQQARSTHSGSSRMDSSFSVSCHTTQRTFSRVSACNKTKQERLAY